MRWLVLKTDWFSFLRPNCFIKNVSFQTLRFQHTMSFTENNTQVSAETHDMDAEGKDVCAAADSKGKTNYGKRKNEETGKAVSKKRKRGGRQLLPGQRYVPPPRKLNAGVSFNQEHFAETSYYFENGLRKVHPYYFDFKVYCKGRWVGKSLQDVFNQEFRAESLDYYNAATKEGRIRLNETPVKDLNVILQNSDLVINTVHRHEPPVCGNPLEVLVDDGEVVVVNKPSSIPVHPSGRYRHNTVIFILGKENGLVGLHTVHRLDRLTSGVLLFARTLEASKTLSSLVRERKLEKEYVCRVEGEFPEGELVCEEPIQVVSFFIGLCRVDPKGKESRTVFQRLSYNGVSSVVRCLPLTGRTHQIRVHLQFLGFPILNDPIYASTAWGPNRAKGGLMISEEGVLAALTQEHRSKESLHLLDLPDYEVSEKHIPEPEKQKVALESKGDSCPDCSSKVSQDESKTDCDKDPEKNRSADEQSVGESTSQHEDNDLRPDEASRTAVRDHLCSECKIVRMDPTQKDLVMYLHALRYKGPGFEYSTQLPDWAKEDWVQE